ncbi:MAG TPA: efflux RND transporter periplasmic adaptor subunit [Pseudomonadales bacterium]|nr:efflux RND transporter periplasmic adaptor subunit [Pseudomonadales bacterium]
MNPRLLIVAAVALAIGALAGHFLMPAAPSAQAGRDAERAPLYWVAPMDPDYRRDAPGKSPMGMDLVPVYEDGAEGAAPGVHVDPTMAHNFGVRLATVTRAPLDDGFSTLGSVALAEPLITHVHPRVSGWVERLSVSAEGDPVRAGDVLLELYSPELVRAQEEFLIARRSSDTGLAEASRTRLHALGMEPAQIDVLARRGTVLERMPVRAEADGFVIELKVREGMYIEPRTEVMAFGKTDPVWVFAEVFEHQVSAVAVGQAARLTLDSLPGREWQGDVEYLYPQLDLPMRTLQVRMRFANPDGALRPGMFGRVRLSGMDATPVLLVPREALIRGAGDAPDRVVVALADDRYRARAVRIGRVAGDRVEILAGLREGERVVASGQFLIDSESDVDAEFLRMGAGVAGVEAASVVPPAGRAAEAKNHAGMNHGDMDHGDMDHGAMNHGGKEAEVMDHAEMNHGDMDHATMEHGGTAAEVMDHAAMNHADMDHATMEHGGTAAEAKNHAEMNHAEMNHGEMNHGDMDHADMDAPVEAPAMERRR